MMRPRTLKQEIHAAQVVKVYIDKDYCAPINQLVRITKVEARDIVDFALKGRKPVASWADTRTLVLIPRPRT